jgi:hypothetical protein
LLYTVIPSSDTCPVGCSARGGTMGGKLSSVTGCWHIPPTTPWGEAGGQGWGSVTWSELERCDTSTPRWGEGQCWAGGPSCTILPWPPGGGGMGEGKLGRSAGLRHPILSYKKIAPSPAPIPGKKKTTGIVGRFKNQ